MPFDNSQYFGQRDVTTTQGEWNKLRFAIWQQITQLATSYPVEVVGVRQGGLGPVGQVDIQILVQQTTGNGQPIDHGVIPNVPYMRLQGGSNAVIIDPQVGDIGMACFASRDISAVKNARAMAPPGSRRSYDFSDAMYSGGFLNGTPTQYIQFTGSGIVISSPQAITLQAPTVSVTATTSATVQAPTVSVTATTSATVQAPSVNLGATGGSLNALVDARALTWLSSHTHKVTAVGADTNPPTQTLPAATTSATKAS